MGLGGAPGHATRFSELKEKGGGTGSGLGWMKDGTLREIDPQSLISVTWKFHDMVDARIFFFQLIFLKRKNSYGLN